jgi:hypothetical protein
MIFAILIYAALPVILVALALPPAIRSRSWAAFFLAAVSSFMGILLPLLAFLGGLAFMPEWKGGCKHGWIDCFHVGKFALTPLVLWAVAALYALEVLRVKRRTRPWIVLGYLMGAVISTVCLVHGLFTLRLLENPGMLLGMLVPLYVSAWYTVRTVHFVRSAAVSAWAYRFTLLSSLPFWVFSLIASRRSYLGLPDSPPGCFIVSAAAKGHPRIVGPIRVLARGGVVQPVNGQLATFWEFEDLLRRALPRAHRRFRAVYNVWGYRAALLVRNPVVADVVYLGLKPFESLARCAVRATGRRP